jgi:tight adherence protein C
VAGLAGFFLPDVLLYNTGTKRQENVQRALPDALDMMTVCVEAGLGFDASLAQVARNTTGPLAAECARVLQEMQFGKSRIQALRSMAERTTVAELRMLVSALVQASELGIPVATVLREQALEMRVRRRQRAEESAQKVTVKILVPLIFCLFPALMIIVIGPGALSIAGITLG